MQDYPKKQHYIPQFLLEHFANDEGKVWTYDKKTDKFFDQSPREIGHENYFYQIPNRSKDKNNCIEFFLSAIDNDGCNVIRKVIAKGDLLSLVPDDVEKLLKFVAYLLNRIPNLQRDKGRLIDTLKNEIGASFPLFPGNRPVGQISAADVKEEFIRNVRERAEKHLEQLRTRSIHVLAASNNDRFLISDAPIMYSREKSTYSLVITDSGFFAELPTLYIPLSPTICLCIAEENVDPQYPQLLNEEQALSAERFLFMDSELGLRQIMYKNIMRPTLKFSDKVRKQLRGCCNIEQEDEKTPNE